MRITCFIRSVMMIFFAALSVPAVEVVNFDISTYTGNSNSRAADINSNNGDTWNFSVDTPLIAGTGAGTSDKVYGGLITTWAASADYNPILRHYKAPAASDNAFNIWVNQTSATSVKGMAVWKKEDFLNGAEAQTLGFLAGDFFSVNFITIGNDSVVRCYRFVIQQGDVWYVSAAQKTDSVAGIWSVDPSATDWYIVSTSDYAVAAQAFPVVFNDIQAVGLYIDSVHNSSQNIRFNAFKVDASVLEPGKLKLILLTTNH